MGLGETQFPDVIPTFNSGSGAPLRKISAFYLTSTPFPAPPLNSLQHRQRRADNLKRL